MPKYEHENMYCAQSVHRTLEEFRMVKLWTFLYENIHTLRHKYNTLYVKNHVLLFRLF